MAAIGATTNIHRRTSARGHGELSLFFRGAGPTCTDGIGVRTRTRTGTIGSHRRTGGGIDALKRRRDATFVVGLIRHRKAIARPSYTIWIRCGVCHHSLLLTLTVHVFGGHWATVVRRDGTGIAAAVVLQMIAGVTTDRRELVAIVTRYICRKAFAIHENLGRPLLTIAMGRIGGRAIAVRNFVILVRVAVTFPRLTVAAICRLRQATEIFFYVLPPVIQAIHIHAYTHTRARTSSKCETAVGLGCHLYYATYFHESMG